MKKLWTMINELKIKKRMKNKLYLVLMILLNVSIGGLIWLAFGRLILPGIDCLLCFMGYPAIFVGFFGGILYLFNHEFA